MSAPLVVNTTDGTCWTQRKATRDGEPLYALADCVRCPELVMATYAELAEHGIAGSADVLPAPVGPEPQPLSLSDAQVDALAAAGNRVVNDAVHEHLCMCDGWPEKCVSTGNYFMGAWDVSGLEDALPAVLALWEQMRGGELVALRARVAELEAERHSTNEALDDTVKALRDGSPAIAYRAEHPDSGIVLGTYTNRQAAREHCEAFARRENSVATLEWRPDREWREGDDGEPGPDETEELYEYGTHETSTWDPTGYLVTPVEVASEYDEEADE